MAVVPLPIGTLRPQPGSKGWRVKVAERCTRRWVNFPTRAQAEACAVALAVGHDAAAAEAAGWEAAKAAGHLCARCTAVLAAEKRAANPHRLTMPQLLALTQLLAHVEWGGATDATVAAVFTREGLAASSAAKRRLELCRAGLAESAGEVRFVSGQWGTRRAQVWRATAAGEAAYKAAITKGPS